MSRSKTRGRKTTSAATPLPPDDLVFKRASESLEGAPNTGLQIIGVSDAQVESALLHDEPFPNQTIEFDTIKVRGEGGEPILFGNGAGKVSFSGHASAGAGVGVYADPKQLLKALKRHGLDESSTLGLAFEPAGNDNYVLLRLGYDIGASATGSLALGASIKVGVDAEREALYAVVRRLPKALGARTAIATTVASWLLPRQVRSPSDIKRGTWIIAEVGGSVAIKIGAQYGYDFNWVREVFRLGKLSGDIGLKVQLGIAATLGFNASGRYAVVVSRESLDPHDSTLRLRLFKFRTRGWDFAISAEATVETGLNVRPANYYDFIAAVFNLNELQVLKDLEKWTDPESTLGEILGAELVDEARQLLTEVTGFDPKTHFNDARERFQGFLKKWVALPHGVASTIYALIKQRSFDDNFRSTLESFSKAAPASASASFNDEIRRVDFFETPAGMWLTAVSGEGVVSLLSNPEEVKRAQIIAAATVELLDGGANEQTLRNFQTFAGARLSVEKLEQLASIDFNKVDKWLKARLAAFLDKQLSELNLEDLENVRGIIHTLLDKQVEFYRAAREALKRKYDFEFIGKYQKATTMTALLDVELDFKSADGVTAQAELEALWQNALRGNLDSLLVNRYDGVTLNQGILTHEIKRSSHLELTLPYFHTELDHINKSLASVKAIDADGERLLLYDLKAEDSVTRGNVLTSRLSLGAWLTAGGVRVYRAADEVSGFRYSYTFRQAVREMKRANLQYQLKSYIENYFPKQFGGDREAFDLWIDGLDTSIGTTGHNGRDNLGDTLIALEVSVPGSVAAAWWHAPSNKLASGYLKMSRALQARLRQLIPFAYFQDADRYRDLDSSFALLVYSSLPVSTEIKAGRDGLRFDVEKDVYWDWVDPDLRRLVVGDERTTAALTEKATSVEALLSSLPGFESLAEFYAPSSIRRMVDFVVNDPAGRALLESLLMVEAEVIWGARDAGLKVAKFLGAVESKPTEAVKALAQFGEKLTDTFNSKIHSVYGGDLVRPLGTMVFLEAARALAPTSIETKVTAMLDLIVLKEGSEFPLQDFLLKKVPEAREIARRGRLVSLDDRTQGK